MSYVKTKNKLIANVTSLLKYEDCSKKTKRDAREKFIDCLIEKIPRGEHGYAGLRTKKFLKETFRSYLFGFGPEKGIVQISPPSYHLSCINNKVEEVLKKVYQTLPTSEPIWVFLFPTFDPFVRERMFGVNGFTPYQRVIHLYFSPKLESEKDFLHEVGYATAHEYNHVLRFSHFPLEQFDTLQDHLVNEGLAEHFRKEVLGGPLSPWAGALSKKEAQQVFCSITPYLDSTDDKIYRKIFFGDNDFSLWTGYAVGYWILKAFLDRHQHLTWQELINTDSEKIMQVSSTWC